MNGAHPVWINRFRAHRARMVIGTHQPRSNTQLSREGRRRHRSTTSKYGYRLMPAVLFDPKTLLDTAGPPKVITPRLSDTDLRARSASITSGSNPSNRFGIWECSPGRWRREVRQAEFCHFLSGRATFTPDDGPPLEIAAGDVVHFSASTHGVWDVCVKLFMVYDEGIGQ